MVIIYVSSVSAVSSMSCWKERRALSGPLRSLRLWSRLGLTGILLHCHVLGFSSSVIDDLSYETKEANHYSYHPDPEGEKEMFHSKGFRFLILRFFIEMNFTD